MASGSRRNMNIVTTGAGNYDEDYIRKKLERANQKVAAAMLKVQKAQNQVSYIDDSSSDSSDDDMGETHYHKGAKGKPDGAAIKIKKQIGNGIANISINSAKNVQVGDRNVMVINRGGKRPPKEEMMEDDISAIRDAPSVEMTGQQQAVLDLEEIVDDRKLRVLATHIGKQWRRILRKLEISEAEIDQLHSDFNEQGIMTVIFHGLQKWKQKNARNATVGKLVKVLYDVTKNKEVIDSMNQPL
ncbi:receptor-interacting serine/threonine-protein kinase 1-like [Mizuhopecten yessoensis]|uniref:Receptor-interacting serine/threonine-protein kinase 1 n=1 Tax=Mizuhopecten yessoensis TaxID=6573 RepID=A0A210PL15_MIZYE|nr:receptor-interacting serine/threonine-protein kinase 1-like [Mizuhopecten yessoensis]OWF37188.1 Receptor-interacting serine/threonine-protein kinase 1 [Mizuhopecten yessoensis]